MCFWSNNSSFMAKNHQKRAISCDKNFYQATSETSIQDFFNPVAKMHTQSSTLTYQQGLTTKKTGTKSHLLSNYKNIGENGPVTIFLRFFKKKEIFG